MTAGTHVVFGTGPAGRAVAGALLERGARARMVHRSGDTTSWDEIVTTTVDWHRAQTAKPAHANRLAEASTLKVPS